MKTKLISSVLSVRLVKKIFQIMEQNYFALLVGVAMLLASSLLTACDNSWWALTGGGPYKDGPSAYDYEYNESQDYGSCVSREAPTLHKAGVLNGLESEIPLSFSSAKIENLENQDYLTMSFQSTEKLEKGATLEKLSFIDTDQAERIVEFGCERLETADTDLAVSFRCKAAFVWTRNSTSDAYVKKQVITSTLRERYANEALVMVYAELSSNLGFLRMGSQHYKSGSTLRELRGQQWEVPPCTSWGLGSFGVKIDQGHVPSIQMNLELKAVL